MVEARGSLLSPLEMPDRSPLMLEGVTENIGKGGVGMLSDRHVPPNAVLRCEFAISGGEMRIPTLMRVRWSDQVEGKKGYKVGLEFLL